MFRSFESTLSDYSPATAHDAKILMTVKGTPSSNYILINFNYVGFDAIHCDLERTSCELTIISQDA
ncbi:hypothetical protein FocTR4_00016909 [Fusarium oxysporum f. sp. cubense]|nr:hypothetical protein FocTR4_00016909 [Fusarium oxysporum f. sp. cubense]